MYFFLLVIMIVLNYPTKKKFHPRIFQQDIAGSEFQNSVFDQLSYLAVAKLYPGLGQVCLLEG